MKKALSVIAASVLAILLCFGTACNNDKQNVNPSETFNGALSVQSYPSKEEAVKGFIAEEIAGKNFEATFVEYVKKGDLTADEISALNVGERVDSGEKGNAVYSVADDSKTAVRAAYAEENKEAYKEQRVYLLYIDGEYKFYTPASQDGENITRSYFEDVFDESKYANCTLNLYGETTIAYEYWIDGNKTATSSKAISDCYAKSTENIIETYMRTTSAELPGFKQIDHSFEIKTEQGVTVNVATNNNGKYELRVSDEDNYGLEDIFTSAGFDIGGHVYYVKTEYGFTLRSDMFGKFIENLFVGAGDLFDGFSVDDDTVVDFYVEEGRCGKIEMNVAYFMDIKSEYINMQMHTQNTMKGEYTNFGTTVIDLPEEVTELLKANGYTVKK